MWFEDIQVQVKRHINQSIDYFMSYLFGITPQPLFVRMINKYPNHKYLIYAIWQIKGVSLFIMVCFICWFITHNCNTDILCKPYLDILNSQFNYSNITMPINLVIK